MYQLQKNPSQKLRNTYLCNRLSGPQVLHAISSPLRLVTAPSSDHRAYCFTGIRTKSEPINDDRYLPKYGDILRFTGLDISWKEIVLTLEQAKAESNRLKEYLLIKTLSTSPHYKEVAIDIAESYRAAAATVDTAIKLPLAEWIFNDAEVYWLVSVLEASIPMMQ